MRSFNTKSSGFRLFLLLLFLFRFSFFIFCFPSFGGISLYLQPAPTSMALCFSSEGGCAFCSFTPEKTNTPSIYIGSPQLRKGESRVKKMEHLYRSVGGTEGIPFFGYFVFLNMTGFLNPFRASKPTPILVASNLSPKTGFQFCKGANPTPSESHSRFLCMHLCCCTTSHRR